MAVDVDRHARAGVARALERVRPLAPAARWVDPEKLHLTLQFLGTVDDGQLPALRVALEDAAALGADFPLRLAGAGTFGRPASPSVLWLGAKDGAPELSLLARWLGERLSALGFPPDERPYVPHLTIARAAGRHGEPALQGCASALSSLGLDVFRVEQLQLVETLADGRYAQLLAARLPSWRFLPHTAEVQLELEDGTLAGVLAAAARGFCELVLGEPPAWDAPGQQHAVVAEGADPAALLVAFLDELVYLADTTRGVPARARIHEASAGRLRAEVTVLPASQIKTAVKAATLHGALCEQRAGAWRGKVVLDV